MRYTATVRLKKGATIEMPPFEARDIMMATGEVRAKYGFDADNPHRGFTIKEAL